MEAEVFEMESCREELRVMLGGLGFLSVIAADLTGINGLRWAAMGCFLLLILCFLLVVRCRFLPDCVELRIAGKYSQRRLNLLPSPKQRDRRPDGRLEQVDHEARITVPARFQSPVLARGFVIRRVPRQTLRSFHVTEGRFFTDLVLEQNGCSPYFTPVWLFRLRNPAKTIVIHMSNKDPLTASNLRLLETYLK